MSKDHVFRKVGEALFLAQALELNIRTLISVLNQRFAAGIDAKPIIYGNDKRPLGPLIQEMKKHSDMNEGVATILKEALEARNYVAHHFFVRNIAVLESESESASGLKKLDERTQQIAAATAVMEGVLRAFCQMLKIDAAAIPVEQDTE